MWCLIPPIRGAGSGCTGRFRRHLFSGAWDCAWLGWMLGSNILSYMCSVAYTQVNNVRQQVPGLNTYSFQGFTTTGSVYFNVPWISILVDSPITGYAHNLAMEGLVS
jgi:hypothetical protein